MMQYLTKALLAACWFMLLTFPVMGIKLNSVDQTVEWQFDRVILLGVAIFFLSMLWNWCFSRKARGIPLIRLPEGLGKGLHSLVTLPNRNTTTRLTSLGLLLAAVGMDPDEGTERLTFGILDLCDGIPLMPLALGLMAVSELFRQSETSFFRYFRGLGLQEHVAFSTGRPEDEHLSWKEYKSLLPTIFRSTGIGSLIGILPGIGTSVASYLSYVVAKRRSKHPEKFGTGVLEGVASCEAGNNAVNGPNLIPLVTLGIPGNLAAALILGGLMVKGLTPGPTFMENQAPMLYALFTVMLFSNIFTFLFGKLAIRYAHKMTSISPSALHGNILILCAMGCYVSQNSAFALLIMFTFAVVGYIFLRLKLSLPVFLVAYILGSMLEHKLRQSLALSDGDFTIFLTRPISATFLALTVICTLYFLFRKKSASGKAS